MEKEELIKEKTKTTEDFVNAIYQNIQTALQSIDEILKLSEDEKFNKELYREKELYEKLKEKLLDECLRININPKDNSFLEKARLYTSIKMTTISDKSTRHLAEMMLLGTVMGTTTCYKDVNDYKGINENLYIILKELMHLEEDNFDKLRIFLREVK